MQKEKSKKIKIKWENVFIALSSIAVLVTSMLNPTLLAMSSACMIGSICNKIKPKKNTKKDNILKEKETKKKDITVDELLEELKATIDDINLEEILEEINIEYCDELEESNIINLDDYKLLQERQQIKEANLKKIEQTTLDELKIIYGPIVECVIRFTKYKELKNIDIKFKIKEEDFFKFGNLLYDELLLKNCVFEYEKTIINVISNSINDAVKNKKKYIELESMIDSLSLLTSIGIADEEIEKIKEGFEHEYYYNNIINIQKINQLNKLK